VAKINGGSQIQSATITGTQIASTTVADSNLVTSYIKADGTRAFTGGQNFGGFEATNAAPPTSSTSLATKGYVDGVAQGLDTKPSARSTTNAETLTVASGSVSQIAGTTVDGVSVAVNDYVLIPNAPASTGAASGVTFTTQPANGLYKVSAVSTNITVARAPEQSGSVQPAGDFVFVEGGSFAGGGFVVTTPSAASGFTYGTNNIVWTQFSGAGEITAGNVLSKSGNTIQVSSMSTNQIILGNAGTPTITTLSGDATIGATGVVTIAGGAVSLSKQAPLAANSVIANNTGSSATPTALGLTAAATASTAMLRDGNANVKANNYARGVATTTTAAGTTTLTVGSAQFQQATGTTTQTYVLPDATTLVTGQSFIFSNQSTGALTINANGGGLIRTVAAGTSSTVTLIANGSAAGTWDPGTTATATGTVTAVSVASSNGFTGSSSGGATPALTIATSVTGLVKGNGTALSAATAGTDYLAPSGQVVRETPGGTINGSTTAFTLANTPTSGSEMVFKNGLLQIAGGTDYSISGATLTFTTAPESGANLMVSYSK
jgi:hypothetical protein